MIYNEDAAFPYPVLSQTSNQFKNAAFEFNILNVQEKNEHYLFDIDYQLSSPFINSLIAEQKACLVFIIQSKDNIFERLKIDQTQISIPKNRLSLEEKTTIQLHIQSLTTISYHDCYDLTAFYDEIKTNLSTPKYTLLGYSNLVYFNGSDSNPLEIIERRVDEQAKSAFRVELGPSTIILVFKKKHYQLAKLDSNNSFMNMYIYVGLNRALTSFIQNHIGNDEFIDLNNISHNTTNDLEDKLLSLMKDKGIETLAFDDIDTVIAQITDNIIEKFVAVVEEATKNEN